MVHGHPLPPIGIPWGLLVCKWGLKDLLGAPLSQPPQRLLDSANIPMAYGYGNETTVSDGCGGCCPRAEY